MKIVTVVGARPQFIKAVMVSREIRKAHREILIHTGQHYDYEMSRIFFDQMGIPEPDYNLGVGSGSHGRQTGEMLIQLEPVLEKEKPDIVLVYGDTNSTLAGALTAAKLHIPVAHVEAGLRSYNRQMPEEINRVVTDHLSSFLFCPTQTSVDNLAREGINKGVHLVGDVMFDATIAFLPAAERTNVLAQYDLKPKAYWLLTMHRAENIDDRDRLASILQAIAQLEGLVLFPCHPHTQRNLSIFGLSIPANVRQIEPAGYLEMLALEKAAKGIITDSGGVQKEAFFLRTPCVTLRDETEWVETVNTGWNNLWVSHCPIRFDQCSKRDYPVFFGNGDAAAKIALLLPREKLGLVC